MQSEEKSNDSDHVPDSDASSGDNCCARLWIIWVFVAIFYAMVSCVVITFVATGSPLIAAIVAEISQPLYIIFVITTTVVAYFIDKKEKKDKLQSGEQLEELPQQKQPPKQKQPGSGRMHWSAVYS